MPAKTKGSRQRRLDVITVLLVAVAAGLGGLVWFVSQRSSPAPAPRAAIIDQLAATYPDPTFVRDATLLLQAGGYQVDYVPARDVTVGFFRSLPSRHYRVLIFRNHASRTVSVHEPGTAQTVELPIVSLFTSEFYDPLKYVQDAGKLFKVHYDNGTVDYFGISPLFVSSAIKGRLDRTLVIAMGCDGLSSGGMAQAFMDKGAASFISWNKPVTPDHTDEATRALLKYLFVDHAPVPAAIQAAMSEVGPDPAYGAILGYVQRAGG